MTKSKMDYAYEIIKENKGGISFENLWNEVAERVNLASIAKEDEISNFYTDLLLDGRFITLGENVWDLREDNSFDKVHIDMNDIYSSDDDEVVEVDDGIVAKEDTNEELFEEEVEVEEK